MGGGKSLGELRGIGFRHRRYRESWGDMEMGKVWGEVGDDDD